MTWSARVAAALAIVTVAWAACSGPASGQPCRADSDCTEPAVCMPGDGSGVCVLLPPPCMTDSDCTAALPFCADGTCINPGGGMACTSDSDCFADEICDVAAGFCVDPGGAGGAGGQGGSGGAGTGGAGTGGA